MTTQLLTTQQMPYDLMAKSFAAAITRLMPMGGAPLFGLTSMLRDKTCSSFEHGYFLTDEVFKKINTWELVRDADAIITVPAGFRFDGESIPTVLHWLVPPFGQSKRGACVHDYLYRYHGFHTIFGELVPVSRKEADAVI